MKKGFTLIEVMVVAVIVAILAAVAIPAYNGYISRAGNQVALNVAGTIASSAAAYCAQTSGAVPAIAAVTGPGTVVFDANNSIKIPKDVTVGAIGAAATVVSVTTTKGTAAQTAKW